MRILRRPFFQGNFHELQRVPLTQVLSQIQLEGHGMVAGAADLASGDLDSKIGFAAKCVMLGQPFNL